VYHRQWKEKMIAYNAGDLHPAERATLEAHLGDCPVCQGTFREYQTLVRGLQSIAQEQPSSCQSPKVLALKREIAQQKLLKDSNQLIESLFKKSEKKYGPLLTIREKLPETSKQIAIRKEVQVSMNWTSRLLVLAPLIFAGIGLVLTTLFFISPLFPVGIDVLLVVVLPNLALSIFVVLGRILLRTKKAEDVRKMARNLHNMHRSMVNK